MNENSKRGERGEWIAAQYLKKKGWRILDRNVRPCATDRRCEIDIIAESADSGRIVFVEVKSHRRATTFSHRLSGIDARKRRVLLRACTGWILKKHWHGNFRFDVVEIWGKMDGPEPPFIDHIENVPLFGARWRFW